MKGCRYGQNSRKTKKNTKETRTYTTVKRCKCVNQFSGCSDLCNCHGNCGGKKCGGSPRHPKNRRGRKRTLHDIQEVDTFSSNKEFLEAKMEDINVGKVNMLEYVIISAIVLYLESSIGLAQILKVKEHFDSILSFLKKYNIWLPIVCRSLPDIDRAIRQVFKIRRTMH